MCARKPLVADQAGIVEDAGLPSRPQGLVGQSSWAEACRLGCMNVMAMRARPSRRRRELLFASSGHFIMVARVEIGSPGVLP